MATAVEPRSYAETDVLTMDELCVALKISKSQLYKVVRKLKVSYALGPQCPRVVWGDVLEYIRTTSES